jgi:UPF0271 protein
VTVLLNIDGGEHDDEPDELYGLADIVHVACGGHAGDEASMTRVVASCLRQGTRVGAHPSYVDREGFGRRSRVVAPEILMEEIAAQCAALRDVAKVQGVKLTSVKPHGALYHAAHADLATARACTAGIRRALGTVAIVGLAGGQLEAEALRGGHPYLREVFADRGLRADGSMIPRGEPGAIIEDPNAATEQARSLVERGAADTLCIHADTKASLEIARAVRGVLDVLGRT